MAEEISRWSTDSGGEYPARRGRRRLWIFPAAIITIAGLVGLAVWPLTTDDSRPVEEHVPVKVTGDGYVSSHACRDCHQEQHASWHASYHRTMTQLASPESMMGRFDGASATVDQLTASFHRKGDEFWAKTSLDGKEYDRRIVLTTGSHHMQICWTPTGRRRELAIVPFVYLREAERWVPRRAVFLKPPNEALDMELSRWNYVCVKCHTTHGVPGRHNDGPDTRVAEFGISCEACHGPGETHVRFHAQGEGTVHQAAMVHPARLAHERASQICGQCHIAQEFPASEKERFATCGLSYRPGDDLSKTRTIEPEPTEKMFWSDGMARIAGREYNGLADSACFQQGGLSCMSCHTMHHRPDDPRPLREWANDQLGRHMEGNMACVQCHEEFGQEEKLADHTHHAAGSHGRLCYNCHMPHTSYALLKAVRSHQIFSPDLKISVKAGRPNACNLCHLDKSLGWTADHLKDWYGISPPDELSQPQRDTSAALLWLLSGDAGQRALAAWHMGWDAALHTSGNQWQAPFLAESLQDPYDAVRYIAQRSLRRLPGFRDFSYDFVGGPAHYADARRRAVELWQRQSPAISPRGGTILLDEKGILRRSQVRWLLKKQSKKAVLLSE